MLLRVVAWMFSVGTMVFCASVVSSQNYPNRPIRIVTSGPGSGNDFTARLIAHGLTGSLGQQVIVDNRGILAGEIVANARPDGYTLLAYGTPLWLAPFFRDNVPYDPVRDFSPVTSTTDSPQILVVHPSLPVKSVKELIALAKAKPAVLNYASISTGSVSHVGAELFKVMAGVNIVRIPYKVSGLAQNDVIAGQVEMMFGIAASVTPHIKSGRLRALAVTSAQPSVLLPELPTVAAAGLPGYEATSIQGIFAPAKTPAPLINRLNQEIVRVLNQADVKEKFFNAGAETIGSSPEKFAARVKSEMARLGKVIKDAGIHAE